MDSTSVMRGISFHGVLLSCFTSCVKSSREWLRSLAEKYKRRAMMFATPPSSHFDRSE